MVNQNIFFPIEAIGRELDYKLLLAALLLKNNRSIVIAQHNLVDSIITKSYCGIYFGKNVTRTSKYDLYKQYKKNDFSIIHLDEEGAVYVGNEEHWRKILTQRLDINNLQEDDFVCTWGKFQENHYKSKLINNKGPKIHATGTSRFDIYKKPYNVIFKKETLDIKNKYGPYILINTHFAPVVYESGINDYFSEYKWYQGGVAYGDSHKQKINVVRNWSHDILGVSSFIELAHFLSNEFPDINILIRPHPDEDASFYKTVTRNVDNIKIVQGGAVGPWLIGAEFMIHNGSTTAIESYFSGTPIITYNPSPNKNFDKEILEKFGIKCQSLDEVANNIKSIMDSKKNYKAKGLLEESENNLLLNFTKEDITSSLEKIIDLIIQEKKCVNLKIVPHIVIFISEILYSLKNLIKYPLRILLYPDNHKKYLRSKIPFPGFDKNIIREKLNTLEELTGKKISFKFISKRIFIVELMKK